MTAAKIADSAIDAAAKIVDGVITTLKIANLAVGTGQLALEAVNTAQIADLNVTLAKLAADSVDDTKAGNRVPQFYRRQGGSATDWSVQGTTSRTPTSVRMQAGVIRHTFTGESSDSQAVTFPIAFSDVPIILVTPWIGSVGDNFISVISVASAAGFTVNTYPNTAQTISSETVDVNWMAIGPE